MNRKNFLKAGLVMIGGVWVPKQQGATIIVRGPRVAAASGPTLIASDNFDSYADSSLLEDSANWDMVTATMFVTKPASDGSVYSGGSQAGAYWVGAGSFTGDQRSVGTLVSINAGSFESVGVMVRCQSGADTRYWFQTDGTNWFLVKRNAGSQTVIASGTQSIASGEKIRIDASGTGSATRLTTAYYSGGSWTNISTSVDPGGTYIDGGAPGVTSDAVTGTAPSLDNWEGWNL